MDELARQRYQSELDDVRDQIRKLKEQITELDRQQMTGESQPGDSNVEGRLAQLRQELGVLRRRHDELTDFVEGKIHTQGGGPFVAIRDFCVDNKVIIVVAVIIVGIAYSLIHLSSGDLQSEEEAAKIREGLGVLSASETADAMVKAQQMSRSLPSAAQIQRRIDREINRVEGREDDRSGSRGGLR